MIDVSTMSLGVGAKLSQDSRGKHTRVDAVELELLIHISLLLLDISRTIDSLGSHDDGLAELMLVMQASTRA